jgi:cytochrome c biogenesis protein
MANRGWKPLTSDKNGGTLYFSQKGAWTRFGVYIVHISILVIFAGALTGSPKLAKLFNHPAFAFKASIMLTETRQTDFVYSFEGDEEIPLGFEVRCDYFTVDYYNNSMMPKEFLSTLTILEDGKEVLTTDIEVNKPLIHRGITFYQSSYQPYQELLISIVDPTGRDHKEIIVPGKQFSWEQGKVRFGVLNLKGRGEIYAEAKLWFSDGQGPATNEWATINRDYQIERPTGTYTVRVKQLYATGLQVSKDPGVWIVYIGCGLMLLGLIVAFFMSHRKLYAFVATEENKTTAIFAGSVNKNKVGFEKHFQKLIDDFDSGSTNRS